MNKGSIRGKIVAGIIVLLLISISISIFITVSSQKTIILDTQRKNLVTSNDILNRVIKNLMLSGEAPIAVRTLSDLRAVTGFQQLEIYRRDGSIAFNDYSTIDEVNSFQDRLFFERTPRIDPKEVSVKVFQEVVRSNTPRHVENLEEQTMEYYFPILNYSDCRQCHGADEFVRGVAYYNVSLERTFASIDNSRNTLVIFFLAAGAAVALLLIFLMQVIIINPILEIGDVVGIVGEGNLEVQSKVGSRDELGTLSGKINEMIISLREKSRLEIENSIIETRNEENKKYLNNIAEGLILIKRDGTISDQYSSYVSTLFGTENIAGRQFSEFIYPEEEEDSEKRLELEKFVTMIFENRTTEMEMIMSINPLADASLTVPLNSGSKTIIVDTDFQRIYSGGELENVMVIFTDKTDITRVKHELDQERERSRSEVEQIATLLKIGPRSFMEFSEDAAGTIETLEQFLEAETSLPLIQEQIRNLHSLKGSARYLEFRRLAEEAHEIENLLVRAKAEVPRIGEETLREIREGLAEMKLDLGAIKEINETFKSFALLGSEAGGENSPLGIFLETLEKMIGDIADELGKNVEVSIRNEVKSVPSLDRLKNPIIHLVRNALDHGVEEEIERISLGKSAEAHIKIRLYHVGNEAAISIEDDGKGIDFRRVREKGVALGLLKPDTEYGDQELLKLLFRSEFSTKQETTSLSGRGVGLDVVYRDVKNSGGRIAVQTTEDRGSRFIITIPVKEGV
jgi:signal transduction histidine kinase/HAMP domain-containing protein